MKNLLSESQRIIRDEGVFSFTKKASIKIMERLLLPFILFAIYKFRKEVVKIRNLEEFVNFCYSFKIGRLTIAPLQIKEEILELLKILQKFELRNILEIGTANGGTLFLFSQIAHPEAKIISIDLPAGKFGGGYPKWKIPVYKSFAKANQKIYLIRDDSHKLSTLQKVKSILKNEKLDFLFIDGDHTYEGVKRDFYMYSKLVERESNSLTRYSLSYLRSRLSSRQILERDKKKIQRNYFFKKSNMGWDWNNFYLNGIIALHDIVPGPRENVGGVPRFWKEIKNFHKSREIVKDWNQRGYGIGIILFN